MPWTKEQTKRRQEKVALNDPIKITLNGETVEGRICFLTFNDIRVEITYPFSQVSMGLHIAYFALPYFKYKRDDELTSYGRKVAEHLLKEIYEACAFCEANETELIVECERFLNQGAWSMLRIAFANADFSDSWYLFPIFVVMFFLTDWEVAQLMQGEIKEKFGRNLPEDLVRGLLTRARWVADQG
jgi:hypothetical protein